MPPIRHASPLLATLALLVAPAWATESPGDAPKPDTNGASGLATDEDLSISLGAATVSVAGTISGSSAISDDDAIFSAPEGFDSAISLGLQSDDVSYEGGRGLITLEGVTGMFLNPTSGTLPAGVLVSQYCVALLRQNSDTEAQHTAMVSYGVTDWLEVGAMGRISDLDNVNHNVGAAGPLARVRLMKDEGSMPEVSVGLISRNGYRNLRKHTIFVAASKYFSSGDDSGFLRGVRIHGGFRQFWQDSSVNEANASIAYIGAEFELPSSLFLVGEVSNKDDVFAHTPFSFGVQWRPKNSIGLSFAGVQTGGEDEVGYYIGIGIDY